MAGELAPPDSAPLVGRVLCGKWTLERCIGSGGMSTVYAAAHRNGKRVAVKVLHPALAMHTRARKRFLREGFLANNAEHANAVSVLDEDIDGDIVFLVMELLEGETLDEYWKRSGRRLPCDEALDIADGVLDVLESAHAKGIVHRDVKPANVFLTTRGDVKVLDFGIAVLREASAVGTTHSDVMLGTPTFMPREQAMARWDEIDARTDVWAMGAVLYALLSGRTVYEGTAQEVLVACATQLPPSLALVAPDLPGAVIELVDRALSVERERRWRNAGAMREALRAARQGACVAPSAARCLVEDAPTLDDTDVRGDLRGRIDASARLGRWAARSAWLGVAAVACVLVVLATGVRVAPAPRREASPARVPTVAPPSDVPAPAPLPASAAAVALAKPAPAPEPVRAEPKPLPVRAHAPLPMSAPPAASGPTGDLADTRLDRRR